MKNAIVFHMLKPAKAPEIWNKTKLFAILGQFLPYALTTQKIKILKKKLKSLEISFYTCVLQMKVKWCMVAEISSIADRTFWLFGLFCPILPPNNPESQNFEKMKKIPGDISILHKCTINDNYMIYGFWDMKCSRHVFLSFGSFFCPFTKAWKMKISKQMKKHLEISLFYISVPKIMIICYTVPEIWPMTDVIAIFHFQQK